MTTTTMLRYSHCLVQYSIISKVAGNTCAAACMALAWAEAGVYYACSRENDALISYCGSPIDAT